MQSEFNSRRGMRGLNRDGSSRGGGIPFGANRFMGRGPPVLPMKPSGMRNRDTGGPRMGVGVMRGDFRGGSFGGIGEGRYFEDVRDQWESSRSLNMRNTASQLEEGNFFSLNNFGPGPDRGRFRQNSLSNFNSSDGFRNPRGGFRRRYASVEEMRRAKRMFQIPPGRFAPPGPFPPRGNMLMPEMRGRGMRPFPGFARNRRNAMEKNKKPQKQNERATKKPSPPWFDEEVFKLLKDKGKAHKRMKRSNTEANVQAFKDLRKEVRRLTRQKYNDYCIKEGIPNKYTEAAKAKKQKAEEAAAAKAALENNEETSEVKEESTDTANVVDIENNAAEVAEENNLDSAQLANNSSSVVENNNNSPVVENNNNSPVVENNNNSPVVENNNNSVTIESNNSPPVENPCDDNSLMEDTSYETTES